MHVLAGFSPLEPLYTAIGWLLAFFYAPFHSLGLAIVLLTLVVMAAQFPLIAKQTRSMIQMQRVQPEIKKIQQKYKDDRQKQNEELLKFYQENKINPLAGCLPILVTLPIGIAVFRTFSKGVEHHLPRAGTFNRLYTDLCGGQLSLKDCARRLDHYPKGKTPDSFRFLGMNLNWSAHEVQSQLSGHFVQWIPYFFLIALVVLTGWYQVRQTQARQSKQGAAPVNQQMQTITRIMPVFFGVITYGLNSATTLYFVISNAWRIGQQHFVLNKMYEEDAAKGDRSSTPQDKTPQDKAGPNGAGGSDKASPQDKAPGRNGGPTSGARRKKRKR